MSNINRTALIVLLSLITLSCFYSPGTGDVKFWLKWMKIFDAQGPFMGFATTQWDYPPFSSIVLFGAARTAHLFSTDYFMALKLSLAVFLVLTSLIFWLWTKDPFITAILHFSLLLNSLLLVYIDIFFAPCLVLSLWVLKDRKLILFTVFYSIACLIKWQPIIIAPFILLYILQIKKISEWKEINVRELSLNVLLPLTIIVVITFLLFNMSFIKSFASALSEVHLSGNALNFGWIMTYFLHVFYPSIFGPLIGGRSDYIITGSLKIVSIPKILFISFYAMTFISYFKQEKTFENLIRYSLIGYMAYFIFNTGVHENHLFIPAVLAAILLYLNRDNMMMSLYIIIMSCVNLLIFYGIDGKGLGFSRVVGIDITLLLSILNVLFFLIIWKGACFQLKKA